MKIRIFTPALFILVLAACSKSGVTGGAGPADNGTVINSAAVPAVVLNSFNNSFSSATEVEWRHHSNDDFSSQFNMNHERREARFDDKGNKKEDKQICTDPVPQVVLDAFAGNFPNEVVYEWKLTSDGNWKAHFMRDGVKWEATFSPAGALLKTEKA